MPSRLSRTSTRVKARAAGSCLVLLLLSLAVTSGGCAHEDKPAGITVGRYFEREPEPYEEIGAGYRFLVVEVELENVSDEPFYTRLGATMEHAGDEYVYFVLNDSAGGVFGECQISTKSEPLPESVSPGETASGYVSFIVPEDWTALDLAAKHRVLPSYDDEAFFTYGLSEPNLSSPP